jgi:hypothetical protein
LHKLNNANGTKLGHVLALNHFRFTLLKLEGRHHFLLIVYFGVVLIDYIKMAKINSQN